MTLINMFHKQYAGAVFLHTIAEIIVSGELFFPEVADVAFAVKLVNDSANLVQMKKEFHGVKTQYFRAGSKTGKSLVSSSE